MVDAAYRYRATIQRVVDGDTLVADVDLGFNVWQRGIRFRLKGVNCPEMKTLEGKAAKTFTERECEQADNQAVVESIKPDKYGNRWDAVVYLSGDSLNDALVESGHAKKVKP